jgi:hypothetical protein
MESASSWDNFVCKWQGLRRGSIWHHHGLALECGAHIVADHAVGNLCCICCPDVLKSPSLLLRSWSRCCRRWRDSSPSSSTYKRRDGCAAADDDDPVDDSQSLCTRVVCDLGRNQPRVPDLMCGLGILFSKERQYSASSFTADAYRTKSILFSVCLQNFRRMWDPVMRSCFFRIFRNATNTHDDQSINQSIRQH